MRPQASDGSVKLKPGRTADTHRSMTGVAPRRVPRADHATGRRPIVCPRANSKQGRNDVTPSRARLSAQRGHRRVLSERLAPTTKPARQSRRGAVERLQGREIEPVGGHRRGRSAHERRGDPRGAALKATQHERPGEHRGRGDQKPRHRAGSVTAALAGRRKARAGSPIDRDGADAWFDGWRTLHARGRRRDAPRYSPERNAGMRRISTLVRGCLPSTSTVTGSSPRAKRTPTPRSTGAPSRCPPSTPTTAPRCSSRSTPRRNAAGSARERAPRRRAVSSPTSRFGTSARSCMSRRTTRSRAHSTRCCPERDPTPSTSSPRSLRRATSPRRYWSR